MKRKDGIIKWSIVSLLILAGVLFVAGTFWDLEISKKLASVKTEEYFTRNGFVNFLEAFSEFPVYLLLVFSVGICGFCFADGEKKAYKITYLVITGIIVFVVALIGIYRMVNTLGEIYEFQEDALKPLAVICYILFAFCLVILEFWFLYAFSKEKIKKLFYFSLASVIVVILSVVVTQALKLIWARPRFRTLKLLDDYSLYKKWFTPSFGKRNYLGLDKDAFKSFPSGHCSFVATLLCLAYLPRFIKTNKKVTYITFFVPLAYLSVVGLSRIVAGAHYLTDVIAGSMISVALTYFVFKAFVKKNEEKFFGQAEIVSVE